MSRDSVESSSGFIKFGIAVVLVVVIFCVFSGCETIKPGDVGIKVALYGDQKAGGDQIVQGVVWYNRWTTAIYQYPTFRQYAVWTKDPHEGEPADESITFNSVEGAQINADVSVAYSLEPSKVPAIFREYRVDIEKLTNGQIRAEIRDSLNRHASAMKVTDIYGEKKQELLNAVKLDMDTILGPKGFKIDNVSFVSGLRVDQRVQDSINMVIKQTQDAIAAEGKVRQVKAEADQKVEQTRGETESSILKSQAEAQAILNIAKANAQANEEVAKSLTPAVLQAKAIEKWSGALPQFGSGSAVPFINVTPQPEPTATK